METHTVNSGHEYKQPKFVRWALVLGIIIVLNVFFTVIRSIAFPEPQFPDFCPQMNAPHATEVDCVADSGTWLPTPDKNGIATSNGYCDYITHCQMSYDTAHASYNQKAFALMIAAGVLALVAGVVPIGSSIVSSGLSYGGVVALIIGSGSYWSEAGNWLKLAISVIALVVLMYIGFKRFKD